MRTLDLSFPIRFLPGFSFTPVSPRIDVPGVAHSVWGNIPMAMVLVIVGRPLFDRRRVISPQGALRPQTPAGHVQFKVRAHARHVACSMLRSGLKRFWRELRLELPLTSFSRTTTYPDLEMEPLADRVRDCAIYMTIHYSLMTLIAGTTNDPSGRT